MKEKRITVVGNKRQKGQSVTKKKKNKQIQFQKKLLKTSTSIVFIIIFACCVGVLCQHLLISGLDREVTALTEERDALKTKNDVALGKVIENLDYAQLKSIAAGYGMVELSAERKVKETVKPHTIDESGLKQNRWYMRLLD